MQVHLEAVYANPDPTETEGLVELYVNLNPRAKIGP
jgi:hypothetical protein